MIRLRKPKRRRSSIHAAAEKWGTCVKCGTGVGVDNTSYCARRYPQSQLYRYKGKLYCSEHMRAKRHKMMDEQIFHIDEGDRGEGF